MKTVSIVVPIYYNEGSLPYLYKKFTEVEAQLKTMELGLQLVFMDNRSGDNSFAELMKIKE